MKKLFCVVLVISLISVCGTAGATTYTFAPNDGGTAAPNSDGTSNVANDLWDLSHGYAFTWRINWTVPTNEEIVGASLFLDDIRNWRTEDNDLWVNLLDSTRSGVRWYFDRSNSSNFFQNWSGVNLNHWENLPSTSQDITYDFDTSEITSLLAASSDGKFGFGFDPDCHFYNNGITFTIETSSAPVPEPATMLLFGLGLMGLAGISRRKK